RRRLRSATFGKICSTRLLSGKVSSTVSTARLRHINATVLSSAGTARSSRSGSFDGDQDDLEACPARVTFEILPLSGKLERGLFGKGDLPSDDGIGAPLHSMIASFSCCPG